MTEPFEISDGVTIGQGHYRFDRWQVEFETSSGWVVGGNAAVEWGDFFDGTRLDVSAALEFRPSSHFFFSLQWERNAIDLPAGSFHTDIGRARINIFFTPDISWNNFIQYDNVSDQVGINSRFRWIIEPGRESAIRSRKACLIASCRMRRRSKRMSCRTEDIRSGTSIPP